MMHFNARKTKITNSLPNLISLPELPEVDKNPVSIARILREGSTVWSWYTTTNSKLKSKGQQSKISAFENISYQFDGLNALKMNDNYLIYYQVELGNLFGIYVKPSIVYAFKNSCIAEIFSAKFMNAYKLFWDEQSNFISSCGKFTYTLSQKDLDSYMDWHRSLTITNENLVSWQKRSQQFINPNALM